MAGVPDIVGCFNGKFIAIEVKVPGNKPTEIQKHTIEKIRMAGGITGVAHSKEEAVDIVCGEGRN